MIKSLIRWAGIPGPDESLPFTMQHVLPSEVQVAIRERVLLDTVLGDPVMQVRSRAAARAADTSDSLADVNAVALRHVGRTQMAVKGRESVIMMQPDELSERCGTADLRNRAVGRSIYPFARVTGKIHACMVLVFVQQRMEPHAVGGTDPEASEVFGAERRDTGYMLDHPVRQLEQQKRFFNLPVILRHVQQPVETRRRCKTADCRGT